MKDRVEQKEMLIDFGKNETSGVSNILVHVPGWCHNFTFQHNILKRIREWSWSIYDNYNSCIYCN